MWRKASGEVERERKYESVAERVEKAINSRKPGCQSYHPDDIHENPDRRAAMLPFRAPELFGIMGGNTCVGRLVGVRRKWE